eukprot:1159635-Pelagomonas_calceolata.AAC.15
MLAKFELVALSDRTIGLRRGGQEGGPGGPSTFISNKQVHPLYHKILTTAQLLRVMLPLAPWDCTFIRGQKLAEEPTGCIHLPPALSTFTS